ncbi:hypothetical protein KAH27_03320 [bacterium]|nr:hypothetical protein [bacterium]
MKKYISIILLFLLSVFSYKAIAVQGVFNVADYGADLTGKKDSSSAIYSAIKAATRNKSHHFCLYLPKGKYLIKKQIHLKLPYVKNEMGVRCGVTLTGDGIGKTIIKVNNNDGFFWLDMSNIQNQITFNVSDMSIIAGKSKSGTAIKFTKKKWGVKPYRQCVFKNLNIRGANPNAFFSCGLYISGPWYPIFQNIKISGAKNCKLKYAMDTGFYGDDMYQPILNNVDVENAVNGIWHQGHTEPEDGIIYKSDLINTKYGVKIFPRMGSDWAEPGFHVWDSNIQYQKKGIWINGARQTFFHANNFYRLPSENAYKSSMAIWYEYSSQGICDENMFVSNIKDNKNIFIQTDAYVGYIYSFNNVFAGYGCAFNNTSSNLFHPGDLVTKFCNFSADNSYLINVIPEKDKHGLLISKGNKKYNK